jgi:hypothetical protein
VLVLAGENDRLTRLDINRQLQQRIPNARLVSFDPGGHYVHFERHEAVSRLVSEFVASVQDDSAHTVPGTKRFQQMTAPAAATVRT